MGKKQLPDHSGFLIIFLIIVRLWSAFNNLIYDCDETYNYWEIAHYLIFNNGFFTWEYSPTYALRSFFYLWLHSWPAFILSYIVSSELILFYFTRILIACFSVFCELYFCIGLHRCAGESVSRYCLMFLLMSSGTYLASTAFLPNTLSMHLTMIMFGAWFCEHYKMTIFSAGISILIGWPYASIAYIPIAIQMLLSRWRKQLYFIMFTLVYGLMIMLPLVIVDSYHYGKLVVAPLNAVLYNVFNPEAGPELYGLESPYYYLINLTLNFNIIIFLSFLSLPLLILSKMFMTTKKHKMIESGHWLCISSLLLWLIVFSWQAHKEERFMYPIYPMICATAALSAKLIETSISGIRKARSSSISKLLMGIYLAVFLSLSLSRVISLQSNFRATFDVFSDLRRFDAEKQYSPIFLNMSDPIDSHVNVCFGKEWYRYPSSFFLPNSKLYRPGFIKSDFAGQLPKFYDSDPKEKRMKTRIVYEDFNNLNQEVMSRYVKPSQCHFLIDSSGDTPTKLQPDYSKHTQLWKIVSSHRLIDLQNSPAIVRSFYLPPFLNKHNIYKTYHLLRNNKLFNEVK